MKLHEIPAILALLLSLPAAGVPETGVASWYGDPFQGRVAAGGEVYDMQELTAAHPFLPFNTWVRVVNLVNSRSVDVRINDRGPYIEGRIIDISRAAARAIGLIAPGIAEVSVDVIPSPPLPVLHASLIEVGRPAGGVATVPPSAMPAFMEPSYIRAAQPGATRARAPRAVANPKVRTEPQAVRTEPQATGAFGVQIGAFRNRENAERIRSEMQSLYGSARLVEHPAEPGVWRVVVGSAATRGAANALSQRISQDSGTRAFVVEVGVNQ